MRKAIAIYLGCATGCALGLWLADYVRVELSAILRALIK